MCWNLYNRVQPLSSHLESVAFISSDSFISNPSVWTKKQKHVKCVYINAGGKKERADIRTFCFSESLAARFQQASLIAVVWDWERFPSFPRETHFRSILCNLQQFCIWTQMLQIGEGVFFISFCFSIFLYSGLCSQGFCRNIFCCHATYWQHIKCSNCLTE